MDVVARILHVEVDVVVQNFSARPLSFVDLEMALADLVAGTVAETALPSTQLVQVDSTGCRLSGTLPDVGRDDGLSE